MLLKSMPEITIRYFGPLREIARKRTERVKIESSSTLLDLLLEVDKLHGKRFHDFVFEQGKKIRDGIMFASDGDSISASELQSKKCASVREFVILPPISGGASF